MATVTTKTADIVSSNGHAAAADGGGIPADFVARQAAAFQSHPTARLMQNAVTQTLVADIALNRQIVTQTPHSFSHKLDTWKVTNQKKSGRCWMFAGLNLMRSGTMKALGTDDFEFSQNYTLFWDKLERANYFLEAILQTRHLPLQDRAVSWLLNRPLDDGGQWNMFVNVIRKYGVVPKVVMPETVSSSNTLPMNNVLKAQLRQGAKTLRDLAASPEGQSLTALRQAKEQILSVAYRILCIHLGTPPESFDWQWQTKDKSFKREGTLTPLQFAAKYVTLPIDDYVCLVHDPRETSPRNCTYTVEFLGNVVDGQQVKYLNVEMDLMKRLTMETLMAGEPVWMGCDVDKQLRRDLGIWDKGLFDYASVYDTPFSLDKPARLQYMATLMTHAMLFTGVDVIDTPTGHQPRRWRVENSWGEEGGQSGFYVMNDNWFDEYVFEVAIRKSSLPAEILPALEQVPTVLPPWDPMGALAGKEALADV